MVQNTIYMIKNDNESLEIMFGHIKYDEKYMPKLYLTLPELQN